MAFSNGGVIGNILPETVSIQDETMPTMASCLISYILGGEGGALFVTFNFNTSSTATAIRSSAKDAIQEDIRTLFGFTIPKSSIRMMNAPE